MTDEGDSDGADESTSGEEDTDWPLEETDSDSSGPAKSVPEEMDPTDEPFSDALDRVRSNEEHTDDRTGLTATNSLNAENRSDGASTEIDRSGPMSDLAAEVEQRREASAESSERFDQEGVDMVDPDVVWEQLQNDDPIEEASENERDRTEEIIDAGKFCERCEYFSSPPEVHCTNEGTDIAELVDVGTFRVLDCPKVEKEQELEDL